AALPRTEFPVINVSASLPGASPDTMANAVATPLIKQFATIAGIDTITATSSQGSTSIAVQFNLNRDIDSAAADIQSAIARVQRRLPDEMTEPPSYRKVNPADAPIMILALSGHVTPLSDMDAFAQKSFRPPFPQLRAWLKCRSMVAKNTPSALSSIRTRWQRAASASTRCKRPSPRPIP